MDSVASLRPKVTVKSNYDKANCTPPVRAYGINVHSRAPSPAKSYVSSSALGFRNAEHGAQGNDGGGTVFRPKAKVNSSATARRPVTTGSTVGSTRPSSPSKQPTRIRATVSSSTTPTSTSSKSASSVTIAGTRTPRPPPSSAPVTSQIHTRGLQTLSSNDNTSPTQSNSSFALHHATSMSAFHNVRAGSVVGGSSTVSSSTASRRLLASRSVVGLTNRERSLTSSPTLKIRSKVTTMSKANTEPGTAAASSSSSPSSPVHAVHAIHAPVRSITPSPTVNLRARAPSSVSLSPASPASHFHPTSPGSAEPTSIQNGPLRPRAPSAISSTPTSPPPQFYPITTAVSAANPHRFASARPPAASPPHSPALASGSRSASRASSTLGVQPSFQSFSSMPSTRGPNVSRPPNGKSLAARVDPAAIPLPPHSPPASTLSFSSRSSASHLEPSSRRSKTYSHSRSGSASTSGGSRNGHGGNQVGDGLRATLDNLMQYTSGTTSEDEGSGVEDGREGERRAEVGEEYKVKAAAKSDRKMADLEITNRSLLVINASLEATKHRQAKEIQELRRRLREARLILPPRAFRASKDSTLSTYTDADLGLDNASSSDDDDDDDPEVVNEKEKDRSESSANGKKAKLQGEGDATYRRIKLLLDGLLKQGKAALEKEKDMVGKRSSVAKVLSPQEVRDYHAGGSEHEDGDGDGDTTHDDDRSMDTRSMDTSYDLDHSAAEEDDARRERREDIPQDAETSFNSMDEDEDEDEDERDRDAGNTTLTSEDEVEAMIGSPPILITQPS